MTGDPRMFTTLDENVQGREKITFDDNSKGKVEGLGKIDISNDHSISNALLVDTLNFKLLSVGQLCDLGYNTTFTNEGVEVTRKSNDELIFKGFRYHNLYLVDFSSNEASLSTCLFTKMSKGLS
jgi:hypothetical protein